jgi:hypothetical protein
METDKEQKWHHNNMEKELPWKAWGSWFSWGSPVGLGIFIVCLAFAFFLVRSAM